MRISFLPGAVLLAALSLPAQHEKTADQGKHVDPHAKKHQDRKPNHLKDETSPYLLQHAYNPVDWYPWGKEALEKAKKENKPIFLSIGYSACHWCHVMERESFENQEIAKLMNELFVCIKVDREERPDIDEIYMAAVQALNDGHGGWPMSVWLTPDLKPYLGGTYYPPARRGGMPGFDDLLKYAARIWKEQPDKVNEAGKKLVEHLKSQAAIAAAEELPGAAILDQGVEMAARRFDDVWGGFGWGRFAPKFPHCTELAFLLRYGKRKNDARAVAMVEKTLEKMARGGIYDQIGGGFHRYSVDREWLVPHFEKMLYDNSQLASLYLEAWQATKKPLYKRIATEVLDYVLREMTSPDGGFYSTTDADSEGEEGKFFVWSKSELEQALGDDAPLMVEFFQITEKGNFEGHNIPTRHAGIEQFAKKIGKEPEEVAKVVERSRRKLYDLRSSRVPPGLDDKIVSSWNGLMLSAFAHGYNVLGDARYLKAARENAVFLLQHMSRDDGRLWRTRRGGKSHLDAYLEDYAAVTRGLTDLYEVHPDPKWIRAARRLHALVEEHFADEQNGGYFTTADDHEELILRRSSAQESSLPSDVGLAAWNAARLGLLAGEPALLGRARAVLKRHGQELQRFPNGYCQLLLVLDFLLADPKEVYVVGDAGDAATKAFLDNVREQWPPYRVLAWVDPGTQGELSKVLPAVEGKALVGGKPAAYVCKEGVCEAPTTDPGELKND